VKHSPTNELTKRILNDLYTRGIFSWREDTVGIPTRDGKLRPAGKVGKPDIIAILPPAGQFLGIEIKTGKDRIRPEQEGFRRSVEHVGGLYFIVHTWEDYINQISTLFHG
jgi:hypothetical protein